MFKDATPEQVADAASRSWQAFQQYRSASLQQRSSLMKSIADALHKSADELVQLAMLETHLGKDRLQGEFNRTLFQLRSYADACVKGQWLDVRIDTANGNAQPPQPDIRKTALGLGPVAVFGASNFLFAYSTAGGDTASALAAGCSVVVKGHPAHAQTSEKVASILRQVISETDLPQDIFVHLHGSSFEVGKALVQHQHIKAVGFTGSLQGGRALYDIAAARPEPIPVFSEMGSTNPVFLLPEKINNEPEQVAAMYVSSITQSMGQFCTNPGILVGIDNAGLDAFIRILGDKIKAVQPEPMLHPGIAKAFHEKRKEMLASHGVEMIAANDDGNREHAVPTLAQTTADEFLQNPLLSEEVFGPYSIVVRCRNAEQMLEVAKHLPGQLTTTLMATESEAAANTALIAAMQQICGRMIFNAVPTGVAVVPAMQHGGPYPASTDSRFGAVGADGIRRFVRPVSYQGWPESMLPDELKNSNPLGLWRLVNGELTNEAITA